MAKEPQFKASVMISTLDFISNQLGESALRDILGSFDSKEIAGRKLLPSDWVLEQTHRDLLVATHQYLQTKARDKTPKEFFFEMGRFLALDGIGKYYKPLVRVLDTKFLLTKTPHLWGVIHSHGTLKVEPIGKTSAYIYISDFPTPTKEWCILVTGYIHAVIELTKAREIHLEELECVTNGARCCKFIGEWK